MVKISLRGFLLSFIVFVFLAGIAYAATPRLSFFDFDLKAGRDKKVTLKFQLPIEIDEDTFDVTIHAEGEDENGTDHDADMRLRLEVEKENHLLKITRKTLSPAEVSCNRKNVQVGVTAINIGSEDEEDVTFHVLNSDFGIDLKDDV